MNIYVVSFLIIIFFNIIRNKRSIHILQLNQYNENNRYITWILSHTKEVFLSFDILAIITIFIAYAIDNKFSKLFILIAILFYVLDAIRLLNNKRTVEGKRLVLTRKTKRLIVTMSIILMLPVILYIVDRDNIVLMILIESIITYLSYIMVLIANYINIPIDKIIYRYNLAKAKTILENIPDLKTIGIIGTSGKTDLKNTMNSIFVNAKVNSKATPKHLNTSQGLILTINSLLKEEDKYFITELNTETREMRKINNILKTKYAVLTTTDTTYLEDIKNPLTALKTKFDFINSLPKDGVAVLNKDDNRQASYHFKNECKIIWIGINNKDADIYAENIKYDSKGSKFDVVFKKDKSKYTFETKILGNYNIYNILASIALGDFFGINVKNLQKAVKCINPLKARLGIKDFGYMYQINDFYNPTPVEIKTALDVLKEMPGTKVVVTKGLTELPEKEKTLNHTYGMQIAKIADYVILINSKKSKQVFAGLLESDYNRDKLYVVNNLKEAYNLLQSINVKNVYALFENIKQDDIMNKE